MREFIGIDIDEKNACFLDDGFGSSEVGLWRIHHSSAHHHDNA
jgi:hypothetical protein